MKRLAIILVAMLAGCGGNAASTLAKAPEFDPQGQTKCSINASQSRPLIVEWPSADRGDLEAQARRGMVVVRYTGCEMEVLRHCHTQKTYGYTAFTRKDDRITIRDADELYANVPIGAFKLEGKLAQAGELNVRMTIVGKYEAKDAFVDAGELQGQCAKATHVVVGVTVGAFEFFAGADAEVGAAVGVQSIGAGAKSESRRELLNRDGDRGACEQATTKDPEPPEGCGAFLRLEVMPIRRFETKPAAPAAEPHPPKPAPAAPDRAADFAAYFDQGGRMTVLARTKDGTVKRSDGGTFHWMGDAKLATAPSLARNHDGRLEALAVGEDGGARNVAEVTAARLWGKWTAIPGPQLVGHFSMVQTTKGYLGAFVRDERGTLQHIWQTKPGAEWSEWLAIGSQLASDPDAVLDGQGRILVFARGRDGALWHARQTKAYGRWESWTSLGGALASAPSATVDAQGRPAVFARLADGSVGMMTPQGSSRAWQRIDGSRGGGRPLGGLAAGQLFVVARRGRALALHLQTAGGWKRHDDAAVTPASDPVVVEGGAAAQILVRDEAGVLHSAAVERDGLGAWRRLGSPG
jgi:hypothetical protein